MPETHRHAAIMFTDIVGYTRLMGMDEEKAVDMLSRNRTIHQSCIEKFNGTLIKEIGDGILASFSLASEAVRCAIEIQKECKEQRIPLKIGIHEGDMIFSGSDVIGDGVNIASRLQEDAQEDSINISGAVYSNIRNKADIQAKLIGEKKFKNVDESIKVYSVHCGEDEEFQEALPLKTSNKRSNYIFGLLAVLLVSVALIWFLYPKQTEIIDEFDKSIAVLPLEYLSEVPDRQYLADGVMDAITGHLSRIKGLRVTPRTSVEQYRETTKTASTIGEELNVNYLIEGSFLMVNNQVRLTIQLVITEDEDHVLYKEYDRDYTDIFAVQSEIAQTIAKEVEITITPDVKEQIESVPTEDFQAYELFLKGTEYYYRGGESNLNTAIHFYQQAIELDPQFALGYISLGIVYFEQTYWSDYFKETFGDTLIYFANKALTINSDLADGYWLRSVYFFERGEYEKSIDQVEAAFKLNPNFGNAYWTLAKSYKANNDYINAIINFEKAKKLKIGAGDYQNVLVEIGHAYHDISYYNKAESIYLDIAKINPLKGYGWLSSLNRTSGKFDKWEHYGNKVCAIDSGLGCNRFLMRWYTYNKEFKSALKYFESVDRLNKEAPHLWDNTLHGYLLYNLDRKEEALTIFNAQIAYCLEGIKLKRTFASGSTGGSARYYLVAIYAILGNKEKAHQYLREMEQDAFSGWFTDEIQVNPLFKSLWEDDEFIDIIKRQEMKYAEIRAEVDRLEAEGEL